MLKAFNEYASDSSKIVVGINHENYWNVSGVLSLNKQKKEVKNYASPEELFQMLSQTAITGNVIIQVEAGETFNYTLTSASESILTGIRNRLAEGNYKLILQKDGDADNPAINFTGIPGKELITALIRLGQYIEIEEVNLKIYGQVMDITKIYDFTPQEISSGTASAPVDFTVISNSFVYDWSLVSASESVTGYAQSGTNVIPSTILTNNSLLEGVVKYGVSISFMEIELYSFEYQITVLPDLPDLQVASIEIPDGIIENGTFIISALITNAGKNIVEEKNRIDGIWRSKEPEFDARTAALIGTISSERALTPDDSYTVSFELTAPADSMAVYYYFVAADIYNAIRESEETNNWLRSNPVTVYPYMMDETDYTNLLTFYNHFGGISWTNRQWNIASMRIFNNWGSITFDRGRVTKIELPSNNVTGELSDMLYHFPYLTTLNLYDNRLSGSLSDLSGSDNRPDSLVALNLGRNQLKGTIPASVSNWIYLTNLNLSYNQLTDLEEALPENIVQLNLQSQSFAVDSITLSSRPLLPLPSIVRYNHAGRNFDFYPSWQLYRSNTLLLSYYPDDNRYQWTIASVGSEKDFVWKYDSSDAFSLVQTNGLTAGSTIPLKIYFDAGDANIDSETDLLDVQHSLNYIFNEHQSAFNYIAADTYRDAAITVQDLITTINIVLDTDINNTAPYSFRSDSESNNQLFIENGKLVLYSEQPVAASDIRLQGISNKEILPLLDAAKFQSVFRNSQEGTRLIFFSPTRDVIPSGYTVLAELSGSNARLLSAVLASKEATRIPILIITTPTNMPVMTDNLKISIKGNVVHYYLPWNADDVTATLYTIRGEAIGRQVMNRVAAGSYEVNFNINHHSVYILNTVIRLEGQIISKNIKLVY
jgi:hypothetical protein